MRQDVDGRADPRVKPLRSSPVGAELHKPEGRGSEGGPGSDPSPAPLQEPVRNASPLRSARGPAFRDRWNPRIFSGNDDSFALCVSRVHSANMSVESTAYAMPNRRASILGTAGGEGFNKIPALVISTEASGYTANARFNASMKVGLICRTIRKPAPN